jgi:rhodanese-related sulfurtransferase
MGDYTPQQVAELIARGEEVQLIDVRQPEEHHAGRIPGDRLVVLSDLAGALGTKVKQEKKEW